MDVLQSRRSTSIASTSSCLAAYFWFHMEFRWHIGQFLIFVGLIVLAVFFVTDFQQSPDYLYFCSGVLVLVAGGYFMWQGRNPPQDSGRFSLLRRTREKREKDKKR